jgi:transcriptional regulator with XRE-family HTH domain
VRSTPNALKEYRERANLTQTQLAEFIGVTRAPISQWENDLRPIRSIYKDRLIQCLGITEAELNNIGSYVQSIAEPDKETVTVALDALQYLVYACAYRNDISFTRASELLGQTERQVATGLGLWVRAYNEKLWTADKKLEKLENL